MRHLIENSFRYYFNDETLSIEFCTVTNKFKEREILDDGYNLYSFVEYIDNFQTNRKKRKRLSIFHCIAKYMLNITIDDNVVIYALDGDYHNVSIGNIGIKHLDEYGSEWRYISQLQNNYKLCSNGLVYNCDKHCIVNFSQNGSYYNLCGYLVHRLVWQYYGNSEFIESYVIDHINNNIYDNRIENLQQISQNINIKKERKKIYKNGNILLTYNNKTYYLGKIKSHTIDECEKIYNTALQLAEEGVIENYFTTHDYIRYDFLHCGWKIINLPNKKTNVKIDYDKLYATYDECLIFFNKLLNSYNLKYFPIGSFDYYLNRNLISFKINNIHYKFRLLKNDINFSSKVINYYLDNGKELFLEKMDEFNNEREYLKENFINVKKDVKLQNGVIKDNVCKIDYSDFNNRINYKFQNSTHTYVFNVPYNGKYYLLGSISNIDIVEEVNEVIAKQKCNENFLDWLINFKDNDFIKYKEKSEKERIKLVRQNCKGYYYFKNNNSWEARIIYNGTRYKLGYYKDERAADCIYKEAVNMIEHGVFEKWYNHIKSHQQRIKFIFA